MVAMAAKIVQCGSAAIGATPDIDAVISESGTHFIEIVHGDGGCVKTKIRDLFQFFDAPCDAIKGQNMGKRGGEPVVEVTSEAIGAASTTLIDDHNVTLLAKWLTKLGKAVLHRSTGPRGSSPPPHLSIGN